MTIYFVITFFVIFASMKGNNKHMYRELRELPNEALAVQDFADYKAYRSTSTLYNMAAKVREGKKTWQSIGFEIVRYKGFNYVIPL